MANSLVIKTILDRENISLRQLEIRLGMSNGTLRKSIARQGQLKNETILNLLKEFPNINEEALRLGNASKLYSDLDGTEGKRKIEPGMQGRLQQYFLAKIREEGASKKMAAAAWEMLKGRLGMEGSLGPTSALLEHYPDLSRDWLLYNKGEMIKGSDHKKDPGAFFPLEDISNDQLVHIDNMLMLSTDVDERSRMERLILEKAGELVELEIDIRGDLSAERVVEVYKRSIKELYDLARSESVKVRAFGDAEYIKSEGTTKFFSLGQGVFYLLTILIRQNEVKQYLSNTQNLAYLRDFSRYIVTLSKLHFAEFRSFEVMKDSVGGSCRNHIMPNYVVTAKKISLPSGRQMEFIQESECILVFKDRIIFTEIIAWDPMDGSILYDDPVRGIADTSTSDLLELYSIEVVTKSVDD